MAIKYTFICDGCDRSITTSAPDEPTGWGEVRIALEDFTNWKSGGSKSRIFRPLLCGDCQIRAAEKADPKLWVRAEKVGT